MPKVILSRIDQIITQVKGSGVKLIVQGVLLTDDTEINLIVRQINVVLAKLSASQDVEFVDLNPTLASMGKLADANSADGLHLSEQGYLRWREVIPPHIAEACTDPASLAH